MSALARYEWEIEVETPGGAATGDADELERFAGALYRDERALGPCASVDTEHRVLSASFGVEAADEIGAGERARDVFLAALQEAGVTLVERAIGRLAIELGDPLPERVAAA